MTMPSMPKKRDLRPTFMQRMQDRFIALGKWGHRRFSREGLISGLKTLAWLAPLTLLIWIYAEREQEETISQAIPIEVASTDFNRYVSLRMTDKNVIADLTGPRSQLDEIREKIVPHDDKQMSVIIPIDQNYRPGEVYQLDTAERLAASSIFVHSGITITNCKPARLPVFIDEFEEREVDVQAPTNITNLVTTPIFEPAKIKIRASRQAMQRVESSSPLVAYADLAGTGLIDKPGSHDAIVRVSCPQFGTEEIACTPSTVKVTFEVRQSDVKYTIPHIVVNVEGPSYLLDQFKVQFNGTIKDTIFDVKVIGPPEKIADLKRDDTPKPWAVLQVRGDDRTTPGAAETHTRRLEFRGLPDGVRIDPDDPQRVVDFSLVERSAQQ
jgi:hypothetical protein